MPESLQPEVQMIQERWDFTKTKLKPFARFHAEKYLKEAGVENPDLDKLKASNDRAVKKSLVKALKFCAEGLSRSPIRQRLYLVEMGRDKELGEMFIDDKFFKKTILTTLEKLVGRQQAVGLVGRDQSGYMNGLLIIENIVLRELQKLKKEMDDDPFSDWKFKFRECEFQEHPDDPNGLSMVFKFWDEEKKPYELLLI